ncbi:MAG: ABC transporter permease [Planctomycetaceae bacterium]
MLAGLGTTLWSGWRLVRSRRITRNPADADASTWLIPLVGVVIGVMLIVIGSSRFWNGYQIERGDTLITLGPFAIPSWSTRVAADDILKPQIMMGYAHGGAIVVGLPWLAIVLAKRKPTRILLPLAAVAVSAGFVWGAQQLAAQPDDWFWPGENWARTWRIVSVFTTLGLLMGSLAWFGQRAVRIAGAAATAPLALTGACAILWLLGQTPLGQTLVPAPLILLTFIAVAASIFLNQTIYGRYLLALGNNEEAARFSGINTGRMIVLAYVLCSLAAGVGGILFALETNSVQPSSHGNFYELYAIAAAVLGGCSLRGGEGTILGVVIGAAVMRVLYNAINLIGIPSQLEFAIIGLVILLGVVADEAVKRVASRPNQILER